MNTLQKTGTTRGAREKKDHTHADPRVRLKAVDKVSDPEELVEIACMDDSPRVRLTAVTRLKDDVSLEKVARHAASLDVRLVAVERIFSQGVVADLLSLTVMALATSTAVIEIEPPEGFSFSLGMSSSRWQ